MSNADVERVMRELLQRGDVLEADAIREVTRLYADLNLAELVTLLRIATEQDSPLARVGYHDQLMQKWDAAAASLGQPPDALAGMVRTAVVSGITGTADMFAASQQVMDAFTVPPVYQLQWMEHAEKRLRDYWGAEAERLRQEVSSAVREGLERGQLIDQIAKRIQDRTGISRSRAALIARNELSSAAAFAMRESQRLAGIEEFIWRTAGDKRVRPEHVKRNGKTYRWDDPPDGETPGSPIMCRCIARAVIPKGGVKPIPTPTPKTTVRDAFDTDAADKHLEGAQHALDVMAGLHSTDKLPKIPLTAERLPAGVQGQYSSTRAGEAVSIKVSTKGSHQALTTAHETGHFLDHHGFGKAGVFSTEASDLPELNAVIKTIQDSTTIKNLRTRRLAGQYDGYVVSKKQSTYLLQPVELWARAYAQFVAVESKDPRMLKELEELRSSPYNQVYLAQWDDQDFEPIRDAIRAFLKSLGWM